MGKVCEAEFIKGLFRKKKPSDDPEKSIARGPEAEMSETTSQKKEVDQQIAIPQKADLFMSLDEQFSAYKLFGGEIVDAEQTMEERLYSFFHTFEKCLCATFTPSSVSILMRSIYVLPRSPANLRKFEPCLRSIKTTGLFGSRRALFTKSPAKVIRSIKDCMEKDEYEALQKALTGLRPIGSECSDDILKMSESTAFVDRYSWQHLRKRHDRTRATVLTAAAGEAQDHIHKFTIRLVSKYSRESVKNFHSVLCASHLKDDRDLEAFVEHFSLCGAKIDEDKTYAMRITIEPLLPFKSQAFCSLFDAESITAIENAIGRLSIVPFGLRLIGLPPSGSEPRSDWKSYFSKAGFVRRYTVEHLKSLTSGTDLNLEEVYCDAFEIQRHFNEIFYDLSYHTPAKDICELHRNVCRIPVKLENIKKLRLHIEGTRLKFKKNRWFYGQVRHDPSIVIKMSQIEEVTSGDYYSAVEESLRALWPWWARIDIRAICLYGSFLSSPAWLESERIKTIASQLGEVIPYLSRDRVRLLLFAISALKTAAVEIENGYFRSIFIEIWDVVKSLHGCWRRMQHRRGSVST